MANTPIVTRKQLIREVANAEGISMETVRCIYKTLENEIIYHLSSATPDEDVTVKIFDGINIECKYIPEKIVEHPTTRKKIKVPGKIWSKAKITRYFNRKINEYPY